MSLEGKRIVVTRPRHQAEDLAAPLRERGADVILLPAIDIVPPEDSGPLEQAAANCNRFDWIVFSSVNAVEAFARAVPEGMVCQTKVATVGESTRNACLVHGWDVLLTPHDYVAESLVEAFSAYDIHDHRILLPKAAVTRDLVPSELRKRGAVVCEVEAYRTIAPAELPSRAAEVFRSPLPDWVTFSSSSAVKNLVGALGSPHLLDGVHIASIGPITTATASRLGLSVTVEAETHDVPGLVAAIEFAPQPS